jgi:hypothetical protein
VIIIYFRDNFNLISDKRVKNITIGENRRSNLLSNPGKRNKALVHQPSYSAQTILSASDSGSESLAVERQKKKRGAKAKKL